MTVLTILLSSPSRGATLIDSDGDGFYLPVAPSVVAGLQTKVVVMEKALKKAGATVNRKVRKAKMKRIARALEVARGDLQVATLANSRPDCNDAVFEINPDADEFPDNGDDNCNGIIDEGFTDADEDGFFAEFDDCDDGNSSIHPGAREVLDGFDNDCNGLIDDNPVDGPG